MILIRLLALLLQVHPPLGVCLIMIFASIGRGRPATLQSSSGGRKPRRATANITRGFKLRRPFCCQAASLGTIP